MAKENQKKRKAKEDLESDSDEEVRHEKKKVKGQRGDEARMECDFDMYLGAPKLGKSHLIRWHIIQGVALNLWSYILVLCPHLNDFNFIEPQEAVRTDTENYPEIVENLIKGQQNVIHRLGRVPGKGEGRVLLVIDDSLGSVNWALPIWTKLASTFRQWGIDVKISSQYIPRIPKMFFSTATKGFVFRMNMDSDVQYVWTRWVAPYETGLKSATDLNNFFKEKMPVEQHKFLTIDRNHNAKTNVFLDRAPPKETFWNKRVKLF